MILNEIKKLNERRPKRDQAEQLITHLQNLGFKVFGREAMEKFLKEHNLQNLQQARDYYIDIDDAEEIEVLRHDLFGKFKNKSSFGCIGRTANYWYLCDYFGDSTYKVRAQIFIDGNEEYINKIERELGKRTFRNTEGFIRWVTTITNEEGQHNNGNVDVKVIKGKTTENVSMASQQLPSEDNTDSGTSDGHGSVYNAEHQIETFTTPQGEVFGLMTKYGNKTAYGDVVYTANYEYTVNYKGAGEFDIIECHKIDNNLKEKINDEERRRVSGSLDRLSTRDEIAKSQYSSDSYHVEDRETNGNNVGLDKQTSQGKSNQTSSDVGSSQNKGWSTIKRDSATGRITFVEGDGKTNSTVEDWRNIETFTTPQGEVFGFVDKEGNIYLDETKITPEHPIHEYTHLWDRALQQRNPELWNRGVELMKQIPLWNEILSCNRKIT